MMRRPGRRTFIAALAAALAAGAAQGQVQLVPQTPPPEAELRLAATFGADPAPITSGLRWRIYAAAGSEPQLIQESQEAAPAFVLPPGEYVAHVAYGYASNSKRLTVRRGINTDRLSISAGGLVIKASIADQPIAPGRLSLAVYIPAPGNSEDKLVTSAVKSDELLRLPEGTYHVVSVYGDTNSIVRADIAVRSGKVTVATMLHKAATITLKLVTRAGGEAIANTAWTVLTPGGDVIREAIGAFPTIALAEGVYTAIARNAGNAYTSEFKIVSGLDRDIEVLAQDPQPR